jgi:hypothetical protein
VTRVASELKFRLTDLEVKGTNSRYDIESLTSHSWRHRNLDIFLRKRLTRRHNEPFSVRGACDPDWQSLSCLVTNYICGSYVDFTLFPLLLPQKKNPNISIQHLLPPFLLESLPHFVSQYSCLTISIML